MRTWSLRAWNLRAGDWAEPMEAVLPTICGMIGAGMIVVAYFGNLSGWLASDDWRFPAANLAGSLMILVSLLQAWNLPSLVIELFWSMISFYGLIRCLRRPPA